MRFLLIIQTNLTQRAEFTFISLLKYGKIIHSFGKQVNGLRTYSTRGRDVITYSTFLPTKYVSPGQFTLNR
jgi:hypothetical protein